MRCVLVTDGLRHGPIPCGGVNTTFLSISFGNLTVCTDGPRHPTNLKIWRCAQNEIDRWSISDRTPGLVYAEDGSLTITLSAERPGEDPGLVANWLPVPPGRYMLGLRVYEGDPEVVDCSWFPPPLTPIPRARA